MDFGESLWDLTFLKGNITTLIVPNHCPIVLSPTFGDFLQSALMTTGRRQGCKCRALKGAAGSSWLENDGWPRQAMSFPISCFHFSDQIALNHKTIVCPMIDVIDHNHFGYEAQAGDAMRGAFDWEMYYKRIPIPPELQRADPSEPFEWVATEGGGKGERADDRWCSRRVKLRTPEDNYLWWNVIKQVVTICKTPWKGQTCKL